MAILYTRAELTGTILEDLPGSGGNPALYVGGEFSGWEKYLQFDGDSGPGFEGDYAEVKVVEATFTRPSDFTTLFLPSPAEGSQAWKGWTVPDDFVIPDDLDDDDGPGPDPDPGDPDPDPNDAIEFDGDNGRYYIYQGIVYDRFGHPVPRDGSFQKLEDVGDPRTDRVLDLTFDDIITDPISGWGRTRAEVEGVIRGDSPLERAISHMHGTILETSQVLSNKSLSDGQIASRLENSLWDSQVDVASAFNRLASDDPVFANAPAQDVRALKQALVTLSVGVEFIGEQTLSAGAVTAARPPFDEQWVGFGGSLAWRPPLEMFVWRTVLAGSIGDDNIMFSEGKAFLGAGNDRLGVVQGSGPVTVYAGAGNDSIRGDAANDTLRGGTGKDVLTGSDGADFLLGEAGDDRMIAGKGNDRMSGGTGRDRFDFAGAFGKDKVIDFLEGPGIGDRIALSKSQFPNFKAVKDHASLDAQDHVVITLSANNKITLLSVDSVNDLRANDFLFV